MKLANYARCARTAQYLIREMMPAFPKPHIRPAGGGLYRCVRLVAHDEFFAAYGISPESAYEAAQHLRADPSLDVLWLMSRPDWALENV